MSASAGPRQPGTAPTLVVVPAYNEESAIAETVKEVRSELPELPILVIDDGSSDATSELAAQAGAHAVKLPFNTGVGGAVRTGLRYALYYDYERVAVIDADGQHNPSGVRALLAALDAGADVATGSRFATPDSPYRVGWIRRQSMRFLATMVRWVTGERFSDVTSGFRAFSRTAIELFATEFPSEYLADTVEVLLIACADGLTVTEVPVTMRPRVVGIPSTRQARLVLNYLRLLIAIAGSDYRRRCRALRKERR